MSAKSNNIIVSFFLQPHPPCQQDDDSWLHCTLCRSGRQGVSTLNKALLRKVEWPAQGNTSLHSMEVCLLFFLLRLTRSFVFHAVWLSFNFFLLVVEVLQDNMNKI